MGNKIYTDVLILGGGIAGLTAGIYTSRASLKTIVLNNDIHSNSSIKPNETNYPDFISKSGPDFIKTLKVQATEQGVEINSINDLKKIILNDNTKIVEVDDDIYIAKAVIITVSAEIVKLSIEHEESFLGNGIYYSSLIDLAKYKNKVVATVGENNISIEEALYLSKLARKVYVIRETENFELEKRFSREIDASGNISIMYGYKIIDAYGSSKLEGVYLNEIETGKQKRLKLDGLFSYIGRKCNACDVEKYLKLNECGYVEVDEFMQTNIKGVFAAGEIIEKGFRQISTSVGDATVAALSANKYILSLTK